MKDIFDKTNHFAECADVKSELLYGNPKDCPNPLVSVIMPVYNRPDTFPESLQSVLNQQCDFPFEIVVVDDKTDCGRTESQDIVEATKAKNIMYYRHAQNLGMFDNWNRGIWLSRGKYVTYCHDDDVLLPNALQRLIDLQNQIGDKPCIFSKYNMIDLSGKYINQYGYPHKKGLRIEDDHYEFTLFDHFVGQIGFGVGCLFNRECMLECGGYDRDFYPAGDCALQTKYTYYYGSYVNNIPTFNYRIGLGNSSNIKICIASRDGLMGVRENIMKKIGIPKFLLLPYHHAMYRLTPYVLSRTYDIKDTQSFPKPYRLDWIIKKIFMKISRGKGYSYKLR